MRGLVLILGGATLLLSGCGSSEPAGPPCQSLTAAQVAGLGYTTRETSTIGSVTVRRQYGSSTCNETSDGARCALSTPGLVQVTANGRDSYFQVTPGQPGVIVVDRQGARCTVGSPAA